MYHVYIGINGTHFFTHAHLPVGEQMWLQSLDSVNAVTWILLALDDLTLYKHCTYVHLECASIPMNTI